MKNLLIQALRKARFLKRTRNYRYAYVPSDGLLPDTKVYQARAPVGRPDDGAIRFYVFSALYRALILEKNQTPKVSHKHGRPTPIVVLAEYLLAGEGAGKFEDRLVEYRSFVKACTDGLMYQDWYMARKERLLRLKKARRKRLEAKKSATE